jgi:hypothetical protein
MSSFAQSMSEVEPFERDLKNSIRRPGATLRAGFLAPPRCALQKGQRLPPGTQRPDRRPDLFGRTMRRTPRHSEQGHPLLGGWKPRAELTKPRPGAPRPAKAGCRPSQQLGRLPACVATTPPDPQRDLFLNRKQVRSQVKNDADVF